MSSKHFIHDPTKLVIGSLTSCTLVNPSIGFQHDDKIVYRKVPSFESPRVSIVSGGGSGHEPGFAGYVGKGLLTAAVSGSIFALPSAKQVRKCLEYVPTDRGVLVLIMNYTGDVLNFGMAMEDARANDIKSEMIAVGDDVAVGRTKSGKVGRRGLAGIVLIMKACGELAARGYSLQQVYQLAQEISANTATVGASLDRVNVPGRQLQAEPLPGTKIELGMGIHNESGHEQVDMELPALVKTMLQQLLVAFDNERGFISVKPKDSIVLLVNNLGGISPLELGAISTEVCKQLQDTYDMNPARVFTGPFLTSLNGSGFSISLLKCTPVMFDTSISVIDLLDAPCEAAAWPVSCPPPAPETEFFAMKPTRDKEKFAASTTSFLRVDTEAAKRVLSAGLRRLIDAEPAITQFDTIVGDGDCGSNMRRGAEAVLCSLQDIIEAVDAIDLVGVIKDVVETSMDGTSGALFTIFLIGVSQGLRRIEGEHQEMDAKSWSLAFKHGLATLGRYSPAQPGDRTMMDALVPFIEVLAATLNITEAVLAARAGTEQTKYMKASLGRSVYVGTESDWIGKVPDPGAYAVSEFLQGTLDAVK